LEVIKLLILPVPADAKPIKVLSFVQSYLVPPITDPTKLIGSVFVLEHKTWEATLSIPGVGFTKMLNV
jgi:hypothetical protein